MSKRTPLTARQQEILDFIKEFVETSGYPPSVRDIVDAYGWCGTTAAIGHLNALVKKGYLERDEKVARGMRII